MVLDTEPTGDVTVTIHDPTDNTNVTVTIHDPTDNTNVTTKPARLVFTRHNWSSPQNVTVTAAQDNNARDETATVTHTVGGYGAGTTADDVTVAVEDNAPGSLRISFREGDLRCG